MDELIVALCKLLKIELPKVDKTHNAVPHELGQKNELIRTSLRKFAVGNNQDKRVNNVLKMLWQQYNSDGHGFITKSEAKHFVFKYFKYYCVTPQTIDDSVFETWFCELDSDGDGLVSMIEFANAFYKLEDKKHFTKVRSRSAQIRVI